MAKGFYVYGATKIPAVAKPETVPLFREALGRSLRQKRVEKGLGLRELARMASYSPSMVSDAELGKKEISSNALSSLSEALGVEVSSILRTVADIISSAELAYAEAAA